MIIFYILLIVAVVNVYMLLRNDMREYNRGYNNALKQYTKTKQLLPYENPENSYQFGFNDGCDFIHNHM
jgi:hypothetical protein